MLVSAPRGLRLGVVSVGAASSYFSYEAVEDDDGASSSSSYTVSGGSPMSERTLRFSMVE